MRKRFEGSSFTDFSRPYCNGGVELKPDSSIQQLTLLLMVKPGQRGYHFAGALECFLIALLYTVPIALVREVRLLEISLRRVFADWYLVPLDLAQQCPTVPPSDAANSSNARSTSSVERCDDPRTTWQATFFQCCHHCSTLLKCTPNSQHSSEMSDPGSIAGSLGFASSFSDADGKTPLLRSLRCLSSVNSRCFIAQPRCIADLTLTAKIAATTSSW